MTCRLCIVGLTAQLLQSMPAPVHSAVVHCAAGQPVREGAVLCTLNGTAEVHLQLAGTVVDVNSCTPSVENVSTLS